MADIIINSNVPLTRYVASAGQTVFTYDFPIFASTDLKVLLNGITKTITTDYTVTGAGDNAGGTVVFNTGLSVDDIVVVFSDITIERITDFQENGDLLASTLNTELDRIVRMLQQIDSVSTGPEGTISFSNAVDGLPLTSLTQSVADRRNKVLSFDSTGQPTIEQELGEWQGNWSATTGYSKRDLVKTTNGNVYMALTDHTSDSTFVVGSDWALLIDNVSATASAAAAALSETAAETAETGAVSAKDDAETAETNAETAEANAASAKDSAVTAKDLAETAEAGAESAAATGAATGVATALTTDQTWTGDNTLTDITETAVSKAVSFTPDLSDGSIFILTATGTITMPTAEIGKSFSVYVNTGTHVTWAGSPKWSRGTEPTKGSGLDIYSFVSNGSLWFGGQAGTNFS